MRRIKHISTNEPRKVSPLHGKLMALLHRAGVDDDARHELVYAWTKGRTKSSTMLTNEELRDIIWKFENQFTIARHEADGTRRGVDLVVDAELKRLRSVILKIATYVGIKERDGFESFNRFMVSRSILKKELHKYTLEELHLLRAQFHQLEKNYERSAQNAGTKAWYDKKHLPGVITN